ncbi:MAG: patatin family protein, partial [Ruminococcus sp.]|nr:patatin family protein [Ruminococcus sp.]
CGIGALKRDKGITGFSYLFDDILKELPLDEERLMDPSRELAVTAVNMLTGKAEYFEKDIEKGVRGLFRAVQASATVPFVSRPVMIDGVPYLDGGCAEKIPLSWKKMSEKKKIVVVRTRELSYRRKEKPSKLISLKYRKYPNFADSFSSVNKRFNRTVEELERKADNGEIFLIAPSKPVTVTRFDGDMDKLGDLYWLGYNDMKSRLKELKKYLDDTN